MPHTYMDQEISADIYFAIPNFEIGGAERVIIQVANFLADTESKKVAIFSLSDQGPLRESLNKNVRVIAPKSGSAKKETLLKTALKTISLSVLVIKEILTPKNNARVISTITGMNIMLSMLKALSGQRFHLVIREAACVENYRSRIKKMLAKIAYRNADGFIAVSEDVAKDLENNFGARKPVISMIHNPVDKRKLLQMAEIGEKTLKICGLSVLFIGRLTHQKGADTLLQAIQIVAQTIPVHCTIVGDGPNRDDLERLAERLGISQFISFKGQDPNPYGYLSTTDMFVVPSRWEGFPNVLMEAIALEVPQIVVSRCRGIPAQEITQSGIATAVDADNPHALAQAITSYKKSDSKKACQTYIERFSIENMARQYWDVAHRASHQEDGKNET